MRVLDVLGRYQICCVILMRSPVQNYRSQFAPRPMHPCFLKFVQHTSETECCHLARQVRHICRTGVTTLLVVTSIIDSRPATSFVAPRELMKSNSVGK